MSFDDWDDEEGGETEPPREETLGDKIATWVLVTLYFLLIGGWALAVTTLGCQDRHAGALCKPFKIEHLSR